MTISDKDLKKAITKVIRHFILNNKTDFGSDEFVVKGYKIRFRKAAIKKADWDDYGVDPYTDHFCIVEFWDSKNEEDVDHCVCVILTICNDGTIGTAGVPFDFDMEGTDNDFDINLVDQINVTLKNGLVNT